MKIKNLFLLIFALGALTFLGCNDDDDDHDHGDNDITITFLEPGDGETVADASDVHIHVRVEASDENHELEIKLHPDDDVSDLIIDFDQHTHDKVVDFEQDIDLSAYPAGTKFHLEVEACKDHDCEDTVFADIEFSI